MIKRFAKFLSLLILAVFAFSVCTYAIEDGEYRYGEENNFVIYVSDGKVEIAIANSTLTGNCVIPSEIYGCPVTSIRTLAFWGSSYETITVPDTVTHIGDSAFEAANTKRIFLPDRIETMGDRVFALCDELVEVRLPENFNVIGEAMFDGCTVLEKIDIPTSVTQIKANAFASCRSLVEIELPENLESIGDSAFYGCNKLVSVEIPKSVISIGARTFSYCEGLKEVVVNSPISVVAGECFYYCPVLEKVKIDAKCIGSYAFYRCYELKTVYFSKNVQTIERNAFFDSPVQNVYYTGTKDEWNKISIADGNDILKNVKNIIFVYTETEIKKQNGFYHVKVSAFGDVSGCSVLFSCYENESMKHMGFAENINGGSVYNGCIPESILFDTVKIFVWNMGSLSPVSQVEMIDVEE